MLNKQIFSDTTEFTKIKLHNMHDIINLSYRFDVIETIYFLITTVKTRVLIKIIVKFPNKKNTVFFFLLRITRR